MRGRSEIESSSNVPPIITLSWVFVLPIVLIWSVLLPKHQVHQNLLQERYTYIFTHLYSLFICNSILVENYEICEQFRQPVKVFFDLVIDLVENESIFSVIMTNSIVNFRYFGNIVLVGLTVIEILLKLGPTTAHQHYIFAFAKLNTEYSSMLVALLLLSFFYSCHSYK
jgi:hypothetical protein